MDQPNPIQYNLCPVGGIVCGACHYPIISNEDNKKAIYFHEDKNKQHPHKTNLNARKVLIDRFKQFTDTVTRDFVNELPNHNAARGIITACMSPVAGYPYCEKCDSLVFDARSHSKKQLRYIPWHFLSSNRASVKFSVLA
jgi:hypothetical protein